MKLPKPMSLVRCRFWRTLRIMYNYIEWVASEMELWLQEREWRAEKSLMVEDEE